MTIEYSNFLLIFKYLSNDDLLHITSVSKQWKEWAEDSELWRLRVLQNDFKSKSAPKLLCKYTDLPDSTSWKYIWNLLYAIQGEGSQETPKHFDILGKRYCEYDLIVKYVQIKLKLCKRSSPIFKLAIVIMKSFLSF